MSSRSERLRPWCLSLCCVLLASQLTACEEESPRATAGMDASTAGTGGTGGSGGAGTGGAGTGGSDLDAGDDDAMVSLDAGDASMPVCPPVVAVHASLGGDHVATNDGVTYNSNPPSSGPHCGALGRYAVFGQSKPLPSCNYLHNMEHGAVVLLYKCAGECPEIVAALSGVRDQIVDSECTFTKRVILTPDPNLNTLVAAAAWTTTWTSDCVNDDALASLTTFIRDNLGGAGSAPEGNLCGDGSITP